MINNPHSQAGHRSDEVPRQQICTFCGGGNPLEASTCIWCGRTLTGGIVPITSEQQPRGLLARSARPMLIGFSIVIIALLINLFIWFIYGESILTHPLQIFTNSTPPNSGADYGHFFTDLLFGGLNLLVTVGALLIASSLLSFALYYAISKMLRLQRGRRPNTAGADRGQNRR